MSDNTRIITYSPFSRHHCHVFCCCTFFTVYLNCIWNGPLLSCPPGDEPRSNIHMFKYTHVQNIFYPCTTYLLHTCLTANHRSMRPISLINQQGSTCIAHSVASLIHLISTLPYSSLIHLLLCIHTCRFYLYTGVLYTHSNWYHTRNKTWRGIYYTCSTPVNWYKHQSGETLRDGCPSFPDGVEPNRPHVSLCSERPEAAHPGNCFSTQRNEAIYCP